MTGLLGTTPTRAGRSRALVVTAVLVALAVAVVTAVVLSQRSSGSSTTIYGTTLPPVASVDDHRSVELGVRFTTSTDGWISAIRFYRGPKNPGPHVGTLWGPENQPLAEADFDDEPGTGWREARLDRPVRVQTATTYVASYRAPQGGYAADAPSSTQPAAVRSDPLTALGGVFTYGSGPPTKTFHGAFYYVDVVFSTSRDEGLKPLAAGSASPPMSAPEPSSSPTSSPKTAPGGGDKPGPSNTGVPSGVSLTRYTGPSTITVDGTVIDGKDVTGPLVVDAKNVVIKNSKIHGTPSGETAGVYTRAGSTTITDTEIYGFAVGLTYGNFTALRVNLHDLTYDGVKLSSNASVRDSWIHSPKPSSNAHWDGIQVQNGVVNTVISGNVIDATGTNANSALFLCPSLGPTTNGPLTVEGNWLDGGNFTVAILDGDYGKYFIKDITVARNRFGRAGSYGPANVDVPVSWTDNVWADTGEPLER